MIFTFPNAITLEVVKGVMTSFGVLVATLALCKGVYEYWRGAVLLRAERFLMLREEFLKDDIVRKLTDLNP